MQSLVYLPVCTLFSTLRIIGSSKGKEDAARPKGDGLLHVSELNRKMQELIGNYILLEEYFMVESVKKVFYAQIEFNFRPFAKMKLFQIARPPVWWITYSLCCKRVHSAHF